MSLAPFDYELVGKFPAHLSTDSRVQSTKPLFSYGFTLGEKYALFFLIYVITIFMHLLVLHTKKRTHFLNVAFNVSNQQQLLFQRLAIQTMPK